MPTSLLKLTVVGRHGILAMAAVLALGIAPAAQARSTSAVIEVNQGIGAVHIGQTLKQVQKEVGKPTSKSTAARSWYYDNSSPFAEVGYDPKTKRVNFLTPNSTKDKTSKGIGEQSTLAALQAAYPNAVCAAQLGPGNTTVLGCDIKGWLDGKSIDTSFMFSTADGSGGVESIVISEL